MNLDTIDRFEKFVNTVSLIQKNILKIKSIEMRELGLKGPHVMCLFYLDRYEEGLTAAKLCRLISVDKAAVSRVLSELGQKGYIYYPESIHGKRYRVNAVLTDEGKQAAKRVNEIICGVVEKAGAGLDDGERAAMYESLQKVSDNLEQMVTEADSNEYNL